MTIGPDHGAVRAEHTAASTPPVTPVDPTPEQVVLVQESAPQPVRAVQDRQDQVRWGPVWAGVVSLLAVFVLLELAFFALGWLTLDPGVDDPNRAGLASSVYVMTGLAGAVAFLVGGLVAGATAMWRGVSSGLVQGVVVWAFAVTGILVLTLLGGGQLFGAFSGALRELTVVQEAIGRGNVQVSDQTVQNARDVAGWAVLALGVFAASSVLGGAAGSRLWPRRRDTAGSR
jgi:hypothetical protein